MKIVQIKEITTQIRGVSYSKGDAISNKNEGYIPLIRANNIVDGVLTNDDLLYVPKSIVQEKQIIKAGDIVIAASSGSLNIVGKAAYSSENMYSTFGAFCKLIRPNSKLVLPSYLNFYFQSNAYRLKVSSLAQGANINNLKNEHIDELEIPLPSLSEQKRIAEILDKADALRQKNKQLLAAYDELQQATFLDMFGDPITNPKGLEKVNLNKIARLERGRFSPRPRNDPSYFNGPYPFIQTGDISKSGNRLDSYTQTLNDKGIKVSKRFEKGTIVIAIVGATIGATAILELDVYATDSIIGISVNKKLANNIFLEFVMQFWKPILLKIAPEAARANINLEILGRLDIIVPPITFQDQFAKVVENIEAQKTLVKQSLQESEDLFNGLVQKAFGG